MTCDEYKKAIFIETTNPRLLNEHVSGCPDCVKWMKTEGLLEAEGRSGASGEAVLWHDYAAAALQGILARGQLPPAPPASHPYEDVVAERACNYADAMMRVIRKRKTP